MKHLSGLDAAFLHIESPEMPMHVGSLNVLRLPEGYQGDFYEDVKQHIAQRMHLAEVFTRKLVLMPFDISDPIWVEDEDLDLDYHIRHITLPKPGTNRQLQQYVARLHSSLLDRSRPLWEFFIIDGLKSGEVALYTKAHHAGIDGQAGIAVAQAIFDTEPTGRVVRPARAKVRRHQTQLGLAELASAALRNTVIQYGKLARMLPGMVRAARESLQASRAASAGKPRQSLTQRLNIFAPRTPLNVTITNQRAFAGRTVPLAEVKQIAKRLGVSLNDVVLATTGGALAKFLRELGELPARPLAAAVPVSLREAGDATGNNQVSMVLMTLATDVKDPVERARRISAATAATKQTMSRLKTVIPTDFPILGSPWLISGVASMIERSRVMNMLPPVANLVISNVPGPNFPLYFAGAELTSYYPVSIPAHGMALNVTVQSYNGRLDYGLIACRKVLPDVGDLGDLIVAEHKKLLDLAMALPQPTQDADKAATKAAAQDKPAKPAPAKVPSKSTAKPATRPAPVRTAATTRKPPTKRVTKPKLALVEKPAAPPRRRAAGGAAVR